MKKTKIIETNFGKIVEEIPTCKFDCAQTHVYIFKKPVEEVEDYLLNLARTVPADKVCNYVIHWNNHTESLDYFFYKIVFSFTKK